MSETISLKYAHCVKDIIGEGGIIREELDALGSAAAAAFAAVEQKIRRAGDAGLAGRIASARQIQGAARELSRRFDTVVVIGMDGAAQSVRAIREALVGPAGVRIPGRPQVYVLDTIDPARVASLLDSLDLKKTLFNVVSGENPSPECLALFFIVQDRLKRAVGDDYREQVIVATDELGGYLREFAAQEELLSLAVPPHEDEWAIVLSPAGLVSAAVAGVDVEGLLGGAAEMDRRCSSPDPRQNPALMYALLQFFFYWQNRTIPVMITGTEALGGFADWFGHLWVESLAKRSNRRGQEMRVGPTPVYVTGPSGRQPELQLLVDGPKDKVATFISIEKSSGDITVPRVEDHFLGGNSLHGMMRAGQAAALAALTKAGVPSMSLSVPALNAASLGQLFLFFERATAYAGEMFAVDTHVHPGEELGRRYTEALLGNPDLAAEKAVAEEAAARGADSEYSI